MHTRSSSHRGTPHRATRIQRVVQDVLEQRSQGVRISDDEVLAQHTDLLPELAQQLHKVRHIDQALQQADQSQYQQAVRQIESDWRRDRLSLETGSQMTPAGAEADDEVEVDRIGRYRITECLGEGGFGRVYLAHDEQLSRDVAIKIPRQHRAAESTYLAEACIVAGLDHPAIVPVYDVGQTEDGHCYVVSKWIPGQDLATRLAESAISQAEAIDLVLAIADALDYAHRHGLVHRDIKPANILLDRQGRPYLVDFGLALKDEDLSGGNCYAGTPAYMSPEQARGEAHRVDGRADIFSLGVVLYELLTGRRPFHAESYDELRHQIETVDPRPPRSCNHDIPKELERISLKALSKRAADRYQTAAELAEDLRVFLESESTSSSYGGVLATTPEGDRAASNGEPTSKIIPKGLRPYDAGDADFFLNLLPGPRDREGVPTSISQWAAHIETHEQGLAFPVGLIYGPSGCGKSSFVRAGLLPHLQPTVHALYIEATAEDTEQRILNRLQRDYSDLESHTSLVETLADVRRGHGPGEQQKLILVIDQFEQWLQGKTADDRRSLLHALRQCDGPRLQCLLLVRDDFWLAVSRFMAELEVDLVQGWNSGLIDLFDRPHSRKVLEQLGRYFGRLPDDLHSIEQAQSQFLDRAITALQEDDRIVPVRLVLFAEMVKDKPWIPATLRELGGASGVGEAFLEETFSARSANPQNRLHEQAVRDVLSALLPNPGSNIRSQVRSEVELLEISGYRKKPRLFKDLMRILDSETRLLTPVDPEVTGTYSLFEKPTGRYFQLTHDYLVPSLRQWLNRKKQSTRSGRMELRLAERATMWNAMPERRQLPSTWEWMAIRSATRPAAWTETQRRMMQAAARHHARSWLLLFGLLLAFLFAGPEVTSLARNLLVQVRARAAMLWLAVGREETVWQMLKSSDDPSTRSYVVHAISPLVTSPEQLVADQAVQNDDSIRRAMLLAAGEIVGAPERQNLRSEALRRETATVPTIRNLYCDDPDPGVHSATDWLLRRYGLAEERQRLDERMVASEPQGNRLWHVNPQGHTMVWIPGPAQYLMGQTSPPTDQRPQAGPRHVRIRRSFCMASKETTVAQFRRFLADHSRLAATGPRSTLSADVAQADVSWFEAAAYCNWLSAQEGIPRDQWCYEPRADGTYGPGMRVAPDFGDRRGYRLPTEPEWEYACRAGTQSDYFFGNNANHLRYYASYRENADGAQAVGTCKPNDFGLFDMSGNVAEWCQDAFPLRSPQSAGGQIVAAETERVIRGGSFADGPPQLRSSSRASHLPLQRSASIGFRVARTYP